MLKAALKMAFWGSLMIPTAALAAQAEPRNAAPDDKAEILARSNQWMNAMDRQDRATLEEITGETYTLHLLGDDQNVVTARNDWIGNAMQRRWRHNGYEKVSILVRDNFAVMVSRQNFAPPASGLKPNVNTSAALVDVWERQDGQWKAVRRYAGRWTVFEWFDRALGFAVGGLVFGLLGWMIGRRKRGQST